MNGARDPDSGEAYLDRHIPQVLASMSEDSAYGWELSLTQWYLLFGFLDRYFEPILEARHSSIFWTDAEYFLQRGIRSRQLGFTGHPKYLEVVNSTAIMDFWEQRGPPDFCQKVNGQWVCE